MRSSRGLDRLIAFLDAVVAIAITLLVLPLVDVLDEVPEQSLSTVLRDNDRLFGAFFLSFAVIARLWRVHHRMMERVDGHDPAFVSLNLAWVLTIVFLPFATQVAAVYGSDVRLAVALYLGTITISSLLLTALSLLISRREALRSEPESDDRPGRTTTSVLLLIAFAVGVAVPAVNYWAVFLLLLTGPIEYLARRRAGITSAAVDRADG